MGGSKVELKATMVPGTGKKNSWAKTGHVPICPMAKHRKINIDINFFTIMKV
jgi:hypothetical protein